MAREIDSSSWTGRPKQRISIVAAFSLVAVALVFDSTQDLALFLIVLPGIGAAFDIVISWLVSTLAAIVFGVWFAILGVNYFTGKAPAKKLLIVLGCLIVELVPFLDALPAITFGVVALIIQTRLEDEPGNMGTLAGSLLLATGAGMAAKAKGLVGAKSFTKSGAVPTGLAGLRSGTKPPEGIHGPPTRTQAGRDALQKNVAGAAKGLASDAAANAATRGTRAPSHEATKDEFEPV